MGNHDFDQRRAHLDDTAAGGSHAQHAAIQHSLLGPGGLSAMAQSDELRALQMKGDGDAEGLHAAASQGVAGSGGPMPHGERIQAAFGHHDIGDVQAHVGGAAEQAAMLMNAQAYATGRSVAFARQPDLHTAAHEAAHVVQQQGGVSLAGGVGQAGDAHEQHADAVADAVVAGRSAEGLLDQYAGRGGGGAAVQRQAAAPQATAAPAAQSLDDLVASLGKAQTKDERTAAATALTDWCRDNLVDDARLSGFLARPDVTAEEKTRILGELRVGVARNEFLLGWSYHGGVDTIGEDGWETHAIDGKTAVNSGPYPSHYLREVESGDGEEWCTSFAGQTHTRLGHRPGPRDPKTFGEEAQWQTAAGSTFWSGSRLYNWAKSGQDRSGNQLTDPAEALAKGKAGSALIDYHVWKRLGRSLQRAKDSERGEKVDALLASKGTPQAGDVLLLGENNDFRRGKSHTALIESFDASARMIYTVEGNTDHAVLGRAFDLTDTDDVAQIIAVIRVGADFFEVGPDPAAAASPAASGAKEGQTPAPGAAASPGKAPAAPAGPDGAEIVEAMKAINRKIAAVARSRKWLKGKDDDASAYELRGGKKAGNAKIQ